MLSYKVKRQSRPTLSNNIFDFDWSQAEEGKISYHLWASNNYEPETKFYFLYDEENLWGLMLTRGEYELEPRAEVEEFKGAVHNDSCLEFFMAFEPDNNNYLNLETNRKATIHLGIGENRDERILPDQEELKGLSLFAIDSKDNQIKGINFAYEWGIGFNIPAKLLFELWHKYANASDSLDSTFYPGQVIKANLYKCGDLTPEPHYLAWNKITTANPDFHRPEYFADLVFE